MPDEKKLTKPSRQAKYIKMNCEKLTLTLPKGTKAKWAAYAASKGTKTATLIREYIEKSIKEDGFIFEEDRNANSEK